MYSHLYYRKRTDGSRNFSKLIFQIKASVDICEHVPSIQYQNLDCIVMMWQGGLARVSIWAVWHKTNSTHTMQNIHSESDYLT